MTRFTIDDLKQIFKEINKEIPMSLDDLKRIAEKSSGSFQEIENFSKDLFIFIGSYAKSSSDDQKKYYLNIIVPALYNSLICFLTSLYKEKDSNKISNIMIKVMIKDLKDILKEK